MGVKGLQSYVQQRLPPNEHKVELASLRQDAADAIVVDGMALIRRLYDQTLDWVGGGQFQELWKNVSDFVAAFRRCGLRLIVFFDGGVDDAKLDEWLSRRKRDLANCDRVLGCLERNENPPKAAWFPPPNISKWVGGAFADNGCPVYYTAGEADREMVQYCCGSEATTGLLGQDSDFLVLPTPRYLVLDTLRWNDERPTVTAYPREAIVGLMGLPSPLMPLVGSLVGNDFVSQNALGGFHSALLAGTGHNASGAPLIEAVAAFVRRKSEAAGWKGPRPATPLLWAALDLDGRLRADVRELVEASLAQYEVGAYEQPTFDGASAEMVRRFRQGLLEPTVLTAATRRAIYRGPSLEQPRLTPALVASRNLRAEVYACCCAGGDAGGGGDSGGGGGSGGGAAAEVREYLVYAGKPLESYTPDVVTVPPRLASCEQMWAMPPQRRMACLLRAFGRAARDDALLPRLDAVACLALGPLSLTLLTVRYLRRHQQLDDSSAAVLLCQGLVMAWLGARRQLLPAEMRPRGNGRVGRCFSVAAVHVANLFMRTSADGVTLNSACGAPLPLLGAWQWFDSILFHSMAERAPRTAADEAGWLALLRGDTQLLRVLQLLLPFALATERELARDAAGASSTAAARLVEASRAWQHMHPQLAAEQRQPG